MATTLSEFADRINEIFPVVIREFLKREQTNEICRGKITLPQFAILDLLYRKGESKMSDLARFMNVTTAAMTGLVDRLVRYSYVERVFDPNDRRVIKIKPTSKGGTLVRKIQEQKKEMIIRIFDKLSQGDREEYLRIITKIRNILTSTNSNNV